MSNEALIAGEIRQFAPKLSYLVHAGASRAGITERFAGYDVIITSFDTAIRDEPLLSEVQWNLLILDEASVAVSSRHPQSPERLPSSFLRREAQQVSRDPPTAPGVVRFV